MKKRSFILLLFITSAVLLQSCYESLVNQNEFDKKSVQKYQDELKGFYENTETTPLSPSERAGFQGITFFPINEKYAVLADVQLITQGDTVSMPTSAQKIKKYLEYAVFSFKLDGQDVRLTAYTPADNNTVSKMKEVQLFLPFRDLTSGQSSYGGGRYMDLTSGAIKEHKILLDFNIAYNPYCAYSEGYNCPIPPANNHMDIEILAGASYK